MSTKSLAVKLHVGGAPTTLTLGNGGKFDVNSGFGFSCLGPMDFAIYPDHLEISKMTSAVTMDFRIEVPSTLTQLMITASNSTLTIQMDSGGHRATGPDSMGIMLLKVD